MIHNTRISQKIREFADQIAKDLRKGADIAETPEFQDMVAAGLKGLGLLASGTPALVGVGIPQTLLNFSDWIKSPNGDFAFGVLPDALRKLADDTEALRDRLTLPGQLTPQIPLFIPHGGVDDGDIYPNFIYPWLEAQGTPSRPVDPLVLDLNRDGKIELQNATFFDLNANGFHEYTSWISETDAFLVLDKNGNGVIDNGKELFGDAMELPNGYVALTGFDALKAYDSNGDGKIDANDEIYASLKVLTGAGEMAGLADAGIKSINLQSEVTKEFRAA